MPRRRRTGTAAAVAPAARAVDQFLWAAGTLAQTGVGTVQALVATRAALQGTGISLDPSQWSAWEWALTHRLSLIWGPPGTGKTRTLAGVVDGACAEALLVRRPLRVLVTAFTYNAIDNVLQLVANWAGQAAALGTIQVFRVRTPGAGANSSLPASCVDVVTDPRDATFQQLKSVLRGRQGVCIAGATAEQVFNLVTERDQNRSPVEELFDFIAIDEGSQLDVGHSIPVVCSAAADGRIVVAGDPMQLAPISAAAAPKGAEEMLGSVYGYLKHRFGLAHPSEQMLEINYRSSQTIVEYGRMLCYGPQYRSNSPQLATRLLAQLPRAATPPAGWPAGLAWTPEWAAMLDPDVPVVCFHYDEGRSGQSNLFEGQAVTALIWLLRNALASGVINETGIPTPPLAAHTFDSFWQTGVGIVTPHTAQRALITANLQRVFSTSVAQSRTIRDAIDTVERFQGGQRDVMIASFSVGDPDVVAQEAEFLLELNRFNVMASRARGKLVVLVSDQILDHLATDLDVLEHSRAIKIFAHNFCQNPRPAQLPWIDDAGTVRQVAGRIRTR